MSSRARLAALALSITAAVGLGGCGFTPLYATPGVASDMAAIKVNVPHGRTAFLLGEDLDDYFGRDRDRQPAYRLDVSLIEKRYSRGLQLDNTSDRFETHLIVNYSLVDIATGRVVHAGSEPVEVSYAATGEPYAGIVAQQDGQKRAADEAAMRIRTSLGVYFASLAEK